MKNKAYKAKRQARYNRKKVHVYAEELERLAKSSSETYYSLSPQGVVDAARDKKSVLHECFEWDDKKAGEDWRRRQARMLMNSIEIVIEREAGEQAVPAFINIRYEEDGEEKRRYIMSAVVAKHGSLREIAIQQALDDLLSWQRRYENIKELGEIFGAIEKVQSKRARKK